ncbi:MAG TPA: type II secretion system protein GspM [Nitrospirota bacterium]|nr:type II secretion system protein GspM [Nitrospirota bacterium]
MKLEERDKKVLIYGGIAAALILLYALVLSPLYGDLSRKRDAIPKKERDLADIRVLKGEYLEMQQRLQQLQAVAAQRGPLLTEIENITKQTNLTSKIVSLKPQTGVQSATFKESVVEVRLDNITLYDVVNYVNRLEKATLRIRKLYFKPRFDNPKFLNATILVSSAG